MLKNPSHPRDPLHGVTLENILIQLHARHGWAEMARRIPVRCFMFDPTIRSSLKFLRQTPWARQKLEDWFVEDHRPSQKSPRMVSAVEPVIPAPGVTHRILTGLKKPTSSKSEISE